MESSSRRLSIISSHLLPLNLTSSRASTRFSASTCSSSSSDDDDVRDTQHHPPSEKCSKDDCVFCMIVRGDSPSFKIYEDDQCLCILDSKPLTHGHSLIIPKAHYPSLEVTPPSVVAAMCSKVPIIGRAIMRATGCDSFNLLVNNGAAAGQVVFHTHIHIIPRKRSDCLWTSESLHRRPLNFDQRVSDLVDCVREHLSIIDISQDSSDHEASLPLNYGSK